MTDAYLLSTPWEDPTTQDALDALLAPVKAVMKRVIILIDPESGQNTIDWEYLRDDYIPDANNYIDDALRPIYAVPLRKTDTIVDGTPTTYSRKLVRMAAYYVAARIAMRTYTGADMPNMSPEAQNFMGLLDAELAELLTGRSRLQGQRLKARERTHNPRFEPYAQAKDQPVNSTTPAIPGAPQ